MPMKAPHPALWLFALIVAISSQAANVDRTAPQPNNVGKVLGAKQAEHPDWFKQSFLELAEDAEEANAAGKHVILYFHLDGCPYCYKMVEENFKHSPYTTFLQENFDVIAINVKGDREVEFNEDLSLSEKEFAQHLKIRYTPTLLFLDGNNTPVLRLNGYRSVESFKHALDFVNEQAYRHTDLSQYTEDRLSKAVYHFRDHPSFVDIRNLANVPDKPLAVIFEDQACDECDALHEGILSLEETQAILDNFTVVRLDAHADAPIVAPDGEPTTPKAFAGALGITYRPGIVLFDRGREILRIDGMQRTFHFQELLRYVGKRHYERFPNFRDYMNAREQEVLGRGRDIDVWK